ANTELRGDFQVAPLAKAVASGHTLIVEKVLSYGADVHARNAISDSLPIHYAARGGRLKIAQLLHAHGSSLDAVNDSGCTPLHYAVCAWDFLGENHMVEWLLQQGVNVAAADRVGDTPADDAELRG
ncbi:unnamed protein product, partial [Meganyctiphanes norvegica]